MFMCVANLPTFFLQDLSVRFPNSVQGDVVKVKGLRLSSKAVGVLGAGISKASFKLLVGDSCCAVLF